MFAKLKHVATVSENYAPVGRFYKAVFKMRASGRARPESAVVVGDGYVGLNINPRRAGRQAGFDYLGSGPYLGVPVRVPAGLSGSTEKGLLSFLCSALYLGSGGGRRGLGTVGVPWPSGLRRAFMFPTLSRIGHRLKRDRTQEGTFKEINWGSSQRMLRPSSEIADLDGLYDRMKKGPK